jgi:hypothetical protein
MGCKKSFLQPQPLSFYEPSLTYVDAPAMRAALVSLARNLRFEYYGGNPAILTEMLFTEIAVEGTTDKAGPAQDLNAAITPDLVTFNNDDRNKIYVIGQKDTMGSNMPIQLFQESIMPPMLPGQSEMQYWVQPFFTGHYVIIS